MQKSTLGLIHLSAGREKTEALSEMYKSYIERKTQVLTKRCAKCISPANKKLLVSIYIKKDAYKDEKFVAFRGATLLVPDIQEPLSDALFKETSYPVITEETGFFYLIATGNCSKNRLPGPFSRYFPIQSRIFRLCCHLTYTFIINQQQCLSRAKNHCSKFIEN